MKEITREILTLLDPATSPVAAIKVGDKVLEIPTKDLQDLIIVINPELITQAEERLITLRQNKTCSPGCEGCPECGNYRELNRALILAREFPAQVERGKSSIEKELTRLVSPMDTTNEPEPQVHLICRDLTGFPGMSDEEIGRVNAREDELYREM